LEGETLATASSILVRNRHFRSPFSGSAAAAAPGRSVFPDRDMIWIEGRRFLMGSDRYYPEERPKRRVSVDGFWIDRAPVTNAGFARFVESTGYVTLAEMVRSPEDFAGARPDDLVAGSMVFTPTRHPVPLDRPEQWWNFVPGADWQHPSGPGSSISGLREHPVVHLALADVEAYCLWSGTGLPTEEEWELAAKGGIADAEFAWGDALEPEGRRMANIWNGIFPCVPEGEDWSSTSPVTAYPANGYGLYDMIGNVWEMTADWWSLRPLGKVGQICCSVKRRASAASEDPLQTPRRVLKGGSHLCAANHCRRYRPAARQPHPSDTSTSHVGFRCAIGSSGPVRGTPK
jgi:formylglycine-generating enzyme required for sulfatase activity